MAKPVISSYQRTSERDFINVRGNPVLTIGSYETNVLAPDGSMQQTTKTKSFATTDGRIVNPGDKVSLCVCGPCQRGRRRWLGPDEPPSHGLVLEENSFMCSCGQRFCRAHGRFVDGEWRCCDCAPGGSLRALLRRIFFVRVGDTQ